VALWLVLVALAEREAAGFEDVDEDDPQALRASASITAVRITTGQAD
jgi:hypothetical protein